MPGWVGGTTTFNIRDRRQGDGFELSARGEYLRATIDDQKLLGRSKRQRGPASMVKVGPSPPLLMPAAASLASVS